MDFTKCPDSKTAEKSECNSTYDVHFEKKNNTSRSAWSTSYVHFIRLGEREREIEREERGWLSEKLFNILLNENELIIPICSCEITLLKHLKGSVFSLRCFTKTNSSEANVYSDIYGWSEIGTRCLVTRHIPYCIFSANHFQVFYIANKHLNCK